LVAWSLVAQGESPNVVRVEEDWELVVATPDPNSDGPQVTVAMSPIGHVRSVHAALELNHRTLPGFVPGGLQLQLWENESALDSNPFPNTAVMAHPGETVRWTQSMELVEGKLWFEITDGSSTTWGSFGGQGYLKSDVDTQLENLNGYNPAVSVNNSGIGYASNRVQSLTLKRVRITTSDGETLEDDTVRPVYPQP